MRVRRVSEPAGRDVGDEDGPGAEVVELVHDRVRHPPRHHRADGAPAAVLQVRDRGRLETGRDPAGVVYEVGRYVIVEHHVGTSGYDAEEPSAQDLEGGVMSLLPRA